MNFSTTELAFLIGMIGIITVTIRAVFLYRLPNYAKHPLIRRGMEAVPAAMLVALVIPFTLFTDQKISLFRTEVYAILLALPLMQLTKKYAYGLVFAVVIYLILRFIGL